MRVEAADENCVYACVVVYAIVYEHHLFPHLAILCLLHIVEINPCLRC